LNSRIIRFSWIITCRGARKSRQVHSKGVLNIAHRSPLSVCGSPLEFNREW
jgi:hypothetical protein